MRRKLYLSAYIDLYSRKVVGWDRDKHMRSGLVETALKRACGVEIHLEDSWYTLIKAANLSVIIIEYYWVVGVLKKTFVGAIFVEIIPL